jgi:Transmembrane domain of unknown function (DUF3566)
MPADASGVTTDDQGPRRIGGADPTSDQPDAGRAESAASADAPRTEQTTMPSSTSGNGAPTPGSPDHGGFAAGASQPSSEITGPSESLSSTSDAAAGPHSGTGAVGLTSADPRQSGDTASTGAPATTGDSDQSTAEFLTDPRPEFGPAGLVGEPPPAPVLTGATARGRRGRHASPRVDRASRRGLRVNQRLWSIDPWSVFKVSALFYFCLGLIVLVAGTLLYNTGRSVGTIDQIESFVTRMGAYGECVPKAEVPEGTQFEEDEDKCGEGEVLVGGFTLDDGTLFRAAAIGGTILVVAGSLGNVLLTVLVNLLNELTGGLRHTVIKEPVTRPQGSGSARSPDGAGRRPSGSPRRAPRR